ncbi:MAG: DUF5715 family protein [Terracidiphilus sp.]
MSFTVLLLAALCAAFASATPARPEKAHRQATHKPVPHAKQHRAVTWLHPPARPARRTASHVHTAANRGYLAAGHALHPPQLRRGSTAARLRSATLTERRIAPPADESPSAESPSDEASAPTPPAPDTPEAAAPDSEPPAADSSVPAPPAVPAPAALRIPRGYVPPLKGSHESLVRQNERSEAEGLERIEDEADLNDRIAQKLLVPVPVSSALTVNANLPEDFRYCRPWTARFLADLARAHDVVFHRPIVVSSAVRTVAYQKQLERINGNAAPAEGDIVSPHLTGGTIDIAKEGLPRQELAWMRAWLAPLQADGKIDVEEEFQQACFHITVYQSYVPPAAPKVVPRTKRRRPSVANALATRAM